MRGHYGSELDHDTELMRGWEDDGEWGECETCGEHWDQDGPRCSCAGEDPEDDVDDDDMDDDDDGEEFEEDDFDAEDDEDVFED